MIRWKDCPLRYINHELPPDFPCGKEQCAWWDNKRKCCAILTIARALAGVATSTDRMNP